MAPNGIFFATQDADPVPSDTLDETLYTLLVEVLLLYLVIADSTLAVVALACGRSATKAVPHEQVSKTSAADGLLKSLSGEMG